MTQIIASGNIPSQGFNSATINAVLNALDAMTARRWRETVVYQGINLWQALPPYTLSTDFVTQPGRVLFALHKEIDTCPLAN